jgi:Tfp pilus assembly protein PilN
MRDFSSNPRRAGGGAAGVLLAVGALALLLSLASLVRAWSENRRVGQRLQDERSGVRGVQTRLRSLESARNPDRSRGLQAMLTLEASPPRVFQDLAKALPPDVRLNNVVLDYGNRLDVDMQVLARSAGAYDAFLARLEDGGSFENIVPGDENREGEVTARVEATYRGGTP